MVQELKISLDYFSTEKSYEVSQLFLVGGGSLLQTMNDILANKLEMKVSRWNPFSTVKLSPKVSRDEINKESYKLAVALGLAFYHYD